jgi:hypothetical protein
MSQNPDFGRPNAQKVPVNAASALVHKIRLSAAALIESIPDDLSIPAFLDRRRRS